MEIVQEKPSVSRTIVSVGGVDNQILGVQAKHYGRITTSIVVTCYNPNLFSVGLTQCKKIES